MWASDETRPYLAAWRKLKVGGGAGAGPRAAPPAAARAAAVACARLDRPPAVLFLAVDIFAEYATGALRTRAERLASRSESRRDFAAAWKCAEAELAKRAPLAMASCVRLASKMVCGEDRPLDGRRPRESEREVFRTIGYRIPAFGLLDTVGYLVEMCAVRNPDLLHSTAESVLKLIYLCSRRFHSKLKSTIDRSLGDEEFDEFKATMAASAVLTAGKLIGASSQLAERLERYAARAESDIEGISDIMMVLILE